MRGDKGYQRLKGYTFPQKQTGKVAQLMGMSDEGVRLYEKYGLVYPDKSKDSGYRSFDIMDIAMLLYSRVYRESGFSIKEAGRLANSCEMPEVAAAYQSKAMELRQQIDYETRKVARLEELSQEISQLPSLLNHWELTTRPGMYRLEFLVKGDVIPNELCHKKVGEWMRYVPFTMLSTRHYVEKLNASLVNDSHSVSGLGIHEKSADLFSIEESDMVRYCPPVQAAHTVLHANNAHLTPDFNSLFAFLEHNRLHLCGDIISLGIVNLHFGGEFDRYFHIWAPVE